jgi:hypothetical protein
MFSQRAAASIRIYRQGFQPCAATAFKVLKKKFNEVVFLMDNIDMDEKVHCQMCVKPFTIPADIDSGKFHKTGVCHDCYVKLGANPNSCFGKQYTDGTPLAELGDKTCLSCPEYEVCSKWPENPIIWNKLKDSIKESDMPAKKTAPTASTPIAQAAQEAKAAPAPAPAAATKAATAPKAAAAPVASKNDDFVQYGKEKWRKGTSAQISAEILLARKTTSLKDAVAALQKKGIKSDNFESRILVIAAVLRKEGLIDKTTVKDEVVFVRK